MTEPTTPDLLARLGREVGVEPETGPEAADLATVLEEATALVATLHPEDHQVPQVVQDRAVLVAAGTLWTLRKAPDGVLHFGDLDSAPVRVARDPRARARRLLAPYLPGGFA